MPKRLGTVGSSGLPDFRSSTLPKSPGKLSSTHGHLGAYKSRLELDVEAIIAKHGLTAKGLTLEELLAAIGFPRRGDVVDVLRRKVQSSYGDDLFAPLPLPDGSVHNVAIDAKKFRSVEQRLNRVLDLLRDEMRHATKGSYGGFGKLEQSRVVVILDLSEMDESNAGSYRRAIQAMITEQLQHTEGFNILRVEAYVHNQLFADGVAECVPETPAYYGAPPHIGTERIHQANTWANGLDPIGPNDEPDLPDCLQVALEDESAEAVVLITDGPRSADVRREVEATVHRSLQPGVRLHAVSLGLRSVHKDTINYLKRVAADGGGYFHRFTGGTLDEIADNTGTGGDSICENVAVKRLAQEIGLCVGNLAMLRALLLEVTQARKRPAPDLDTGPMTIAKWLKVNGIKPNKLRLYDLLAPCAFRHVHDDMAFVAPGTTGVLKSKDVHAQLCEGQIHYRWRNGAIVHVYVTQRQAEDFHRRATKMIEKYQTKLRKYQTGTRALFGEMVADSVTILVSSGESMKNRWRDACKKIKKVIDEQILLQRRFNIVTYGDTAMSWQVSAKQGTERNCTAAKEWLDSVRPKGVTTFKVGLDNALEDPDTKALYIVSDGMHHLDPEAEAILDFVASAAKERSITVSTISYCCIDSEANQFLHDLAVVGNAGSFQYYTEQISDEPLSPEHQALLGPPARGDNADITLLNVEIADLQEEMTKVAGLRKECDTHDRLRSRGMHSQIKYEMTEPPPPTPTPVTKKGLATQLISADQIRAGRSAKKNARPGWESYSQSGATLFSKQSTLDSTCTGHEATNFNPNITTTRIRGTNIDTRYDSFDNKEDQSKEHGHTDEDEVGDSNDESESSPTGRRTSKRSHYVTVDNVAGGTGADGGAGSGGKLRPSRTPGDAERPQFTFSMRNPDGSPKKAASPNVVSKPAPWTAKMLRKIAIAADEDAEQWLSKYSLDVLELTIADALASTAIKRTGKEVKIGGETKVVFGKVFEDAFTVAYYPRRPGPADASVAETNDDGDNEEAGGDIGNGRSVKIIPTTMGSIPYVVKASMVEQKPAGVSQLAGDDVELVYVFPGAADLGGYLEKMDAIMRVYRRRLVQLVRREPDADAFAPFTVGNIDEKVVNPVFHPQLCRLTKAIGALCNEIRVGLDYTLQAEQLNLHARPPRASPAVVVDLTVDVDGTAASRGDKLHATRTRKAPCFVRADPVRTGSISSGPVPGSDPASFSNGLGPYERVDRPARGRASQANRLPNGRLPGAAIRTTLAGVGQVNPMVTKAPNPIPRRPTRKKRGGAATNRGGGGGGRTRETLRHGQQRWAVGEKVLAPRKGGATYSLGSVINLIGNDRVKVLFDQLRDDETVHLPTVLPLPTLPLPTLGQGDFVLVPGAADAGDYVAGQVVAIEHDMVVTETVNRRTISIPRTKLMKISARVFRAAARAWDASTYFGIHEDSELEDIHTREYGRQAELGEAMQLPVHSPRVSPAAAAPLMATARLDLDAAVTGRESLEMHRALADRDSLATPTAVVAHATPPYVAQPATEPVLTCWDKDGWFYPGALLPELCATGYSLVTEPDGSEPTEVLDAKIFRMSATVSPAVGQGVLAEHVLYRDSYAPAVVQSVDRNGYVELCFYDGVSSCQLARNDPMVLLDAAAHARIVEAITTLENNWVGREVICRDDGDGLFYPGRVVSRVGPGARYRVALGEAYGPDRKVAESHQVKSHIFSSDYDLGDDVILEVGDGVVVENDGPGIIVQASRQGSGDGFVVEAWDGRQLQVPAAMCYHCGVEYVASASAFIRSL